MEKLLLYQDIHHLSIVVLWLDLVWAGKIHIHRMIVASPVYLPMN